MVKNSVYSGMVNMRKLTMINPAALAVPGAGEDLQGKGGEAIKAERRRRNDRRASDRRTT